MTDNPIETLLSEHKIIMDQVETLRAAVQALTARGDDALAETLPVFNSIGQMMATRLDLHRRKEDDVFFPAIERVIGEHSGPTAVMRQEHRDIHEQGVLLRETLRELNEEQHPAIEAGGERLRALAAEGGSAEALRKTGEEIMYLLDSHFQKEEEILFPMARHLLDQETLTQVANQFAQLEAGTELE